MVNDVHADRPRTILTFVELDQAFQSGRQVQRACQDLVRSGQPIPTDVVDAVGQLMSGYARLFLVLTTQHVTEGYSTN